jgi:hypothetical protein
MKLGVLLQALKLALLVHAARTQPGASCGSSYDFDSFLGSSGVLGIGGSERTRTRRLLRDRQSVTTCSYIVPFESSGHLNRARHSQCLFFELQRMEA